MWIHARLRNTILRFPILNMLESNNNIKQEIEKYIQREGEGESILYEFLDTISSLALPRSISLENNNQMYHCGTKYIEYKKMPV